MANQSSSTSTVESQPQMTFRRNQMAWLLLGIFIGLIFGWLIWPVEWGDASMDDLRPDVRAHFISATADAYAASGGQDPATALMRMQAFTDPQAAVFEAITFFQNSNDPNRIIREVNLRSLASALGANAPTPDTPAVNQGIGWLDWTLGMLAALLLLGGGIWIGYRAWTRQTSARPAPANDPDFDHDTLPAQPSYLPPAPPPVTAGGGWQPVAPPDAAQSNPAVSPRVIIETWDSENDAPQFVARTQPPSARSDPQPHAHPRSSRAEEPPIQRILPTTPPRPAFQADADDVEFGEDNFEDVEESDDFDEVDGAGLPAARTEEEIRWQGDWAEDEEDEEDTDGFDGTLVEDWDTDEEIDEEPDEEPGSAVGEIEFDRDETGDERPTPTIGRLAVRPAPETKEPETSGWGTILPPPQDAKGDEEVGGFLPTVQGVLSGFRRSEKESGPSRGGREIGDFKAEFHVGMLAYEQSFIITANGDDDRPPLGACGVGISEQLDKEAAHSEKVRVLDVWLYDGSEVRSHRQYLITPGMDKESLAKQATSSGNVTGEPLEIAPGLTFRIPSKNLILDCRIAAAELLNPGTPLSPLRSVRIEMTARTAK